MKPQYIGNDTLHCEPQPTPEHNGDTMIFPWRWEGVYVIDAENNEVATCDSDDDAEYIAIAATHHGDAVGALRYIVQRSNGIESDEDWLKWAPIAVKCARMSLQRLSQRQALLNASVQIDVNGIDKVRHALTLAQKLAQQVDDSTLEALSREALEAIDL